jgi:hypothetical protein
MITHLQAKQSFDNFWEGHIPFNKILSQAPHEKKGILTHFAKLHSYFKNLNKETVKQRYADVSNSWLLVAPFLSTCPVTDDLILIHKYFTQLLNYTPISIISGHKAFVDTRDHSLFE